MVGQVGSSAFAFLFSLIVARAFKAQGSGVFYTSVAILIITNSLAGLGAGVGLTRFIPQYRVTGHVEDIRRLLPIALGPPLVISVLMAGLLELFAPQIAHLVILGLHHQAHSELGVSYIRALAPFLPALTLTSIIFPAIRGYGMMRAPVYVQNVAMPFLRVVAVGILVLLGFGVLSVAYAWSVPMVASLVVGTQLLVKRQRDLERTSQPSPSPTSAPKRRAGEFWRFTSARALGAICSTLITWFDVLLVSAIASTRLAGIYSVASRYVMIGTYATGALSFAISPQISGLFSARRFRDATRLYQSATAWLMMVSLPVCFIMAIYSPALMRIFGSGFAKGATSLTILSLGMLVVIGTGNNVMVLVMSGHSVLNLLISVAAVATNIGLNLLLVPHLGMEGAAIAWVATFVVMNVSTSVALMVLMWMHPFSSAYAWVAGVTLVCFAGLGLVVRELLGPSLSALVLASLTGLGIYSVVIWRLRHKLDIHAFRIRRTGALGSDQVE